jgi:Protein of unknown function (DUF4232)
MRRALIAAVTLVLLPTAFGAADDRGEGAIPWLPTRPRRAAEPPLSAPCRAPDLHAQLQVQGATGNLIGGVLVRNAGRAPCSLRGRPSSARFEGGPATATALRVVAAAADPLDTSLIYDRASSLRALGPGRSAFVPVFWSNWCPPEVVVTSTGTPPSRLVLVLAGGAELTAAVDRAPRCDEPTAPSTLAIKPFARRGRQPPSSSQLPLRAVIVGGSTDKRRSPSLRVQAGGLLRYEVALTNVSRRPFRFRGCPTYLQDFGGRHEWYVLNCRPVGVLQPRETARFAMLLRVPKEARLGRTGLFWLLAPKTYLPATAVAGVLITR